MKPTEAWGVVENGELWSAAFATRAEALDALGKALVEMQHPPKGAKAYGMEWTARVVPVSVAMPSQRAQ